MPARTPEDLGQQFMQALNAGDIEGLLQLYEPGSVLRPMPGQLVEGTGVIRQVLMGFLAMEPTMTMATRSLGQAGDTALITGKWELNGTGADGKPVQMTGQSVEVARRQSDGTWRYLIDAPWGMEWGG